MSFPKIILPGFIIADLYKNSLVELNAFQDNSVALEEKEDVYDEDRRSGVEKIIYQGKNGRNVIILINQPEAPEQYKDDLNFLMNVLKACNLGLADIAIINLASQNIVYTAIKEQLKALHIFLFDVDAAAIKLPFSIPAFQDQRFDGVTFLVAPALSEFNKPGQEARLLKTRLWTSLKKIFDIN